MYDNVNMWIRVKPRSNGKKSIQIVESHRRCDKITQKIIRHVGQAETEEEIDQMKKIAKSIINRLEQERSPSLPLFSTDIANKESTDKIPDNVKLKDLQEEQRIITGIPDVFGKLFDDLGFNESILKTRRDAYWNKILKDCVIARLANPCSKRRTASLLEQDFGIRHNLDNIYKMLDYLFLNKERVKDIVSNNTLNLFGEKIVVLYFDVTTLYFESFKSDDLRDFGYSKDCKFKETQVVLSLITSKGGHPLGYELFPGNTSECKTLIKTVEFIKNKYNAIDVTLVADRAMFTDTNLSYLEDKGVKYVVAAKLKSLGKKDKDQILSNNYKADVLNNELIWFREQSYKNRRLIISYSNKRAKKDYADRLRLVERVLKKSKDNKIKIKDLIPNYGSKKYINVTDNTATINNEKIELDSLWDGLHGVITNIRDKSIKDILSRYKGLWEIESTFRMSKHDLKMRPIYHFNNNRIQSHILLCFISLSIAKQALHRINIQQKENLSLEKLRNELLHVQASILLNPQDRKNKYAVPSKTSQVQIKIYKTFGLKRRQLPYKLA